MGKRGTLLSSFEQGKISAVFEENLSTAEIAWRLNRLHNTVKHFLQRNKPYKHNGGAKWKLNDRSKRLIAKELIKNVTISVQKLISEHQLNVLTET